MEVVGRCYCLQVLNMLKIDEVKSKILLGSVFSNTSNPHMLLSQYKNKYKLIFKDGTKLVGAINENKNLEILENFKKFASPVDSDSFLDVELKIIDDIINEDFFIGCYTLRIFLFKFMKEFSIDFEDIFISGGYVLYHLGRTSEYDDIDIFVKNSKNLNKIYLHFQNCSYENDSLFSSFKHPFYNINIIINKSVFKNSLMFCVSQIDKFDIPFCKVAYIFQSGSPFFVDLSWSGHHSNHLKFLIRCIKYSRRMLVDNCVNIPSNLDYFSKNYYKAYYIESSKGVYFPFYCEDLFSSVCQKIPALLVAEAIQNQITVNKSSH